MPATTAQIKELREKTGAGIMECKRALDEGGTMPEAEKLLKQWGLATAEKKAGREASQDRREVGQRPAHPALVDERHAGARRFFGDRVLGLFLGADEEHRLAVGGLLADEVHRLVEAAHRLLQIDDVNAVTFGKDEGPHARVPATGLVTEVDAGFEQRLHLDRGGHSLRLGNLR